MGEATKRPRCPVCEHEHWRHEPHKWAREKAASSEAPVAAAAAKPDENFREAAAPALVEKIPEVAPPTGAAEGPVKPKRQRREYFRDYMTGYRDRKREELRAYQRDYMRRRRQGGES